VKESDVPRKQAAAKQEGARTLYPTKTQTVDEDPVKASART